MIPRESATSANSLPFSLCLVLTVPLLVCLQPSVQQWVGQYAVSNTMSGSECSICYERAIDSVLYTCGHMCMCYECAVQQWRGKGGGHCPMCRAVIRDVIRTYKS